ncbi:MAG TPA: autotransporter-associated beta strand repeat-containing protein [Verrucomicrobiae bacterium]|nr:autotransporter-associated beta strand repeat-containing protein [Verrucomicrobiae bacterium]
MESLTQKPGSSLKTPIQLSLHIIALYCTLCASAAQLTWDPGSNGTNNGPTVIPGSGNWDLSTPNWNNGATDVVWTQTSGTSALNGAVFGGADGNYSITNASQVAVTNLTFNNSGYTIAGPAPIFLTTSDYLTLAPGKTATLNCSVTGTGSGAQYWPIGSGSVLNVDGGVGPATTQVRFFGPADSAYNIGGSSTPGIEYILAPVFMTNGFTTINSTLYIGYAQIINSVSYGTGVLTVSNATLTSSGNVVIIGRSGGSGTLTLDDGFVNVGVTAAHPLAINYEGSANSHGTLNVYGGTLTVGSDSLTGTTSAIDFFDTVGGSAGATAMMLQTNGVVFAWGGIQFGLASGTFTGGSAALTNLGGFLFLGANGINHAAAFPPSISVSLSGGTVGALANWSSSLPMTLDTAAGNITFQCADNDFNNYNISLSGPLTGSGGLNVAGGGTLTLSGTNNYTGSTVVSNGTLAVVTSVSPTNGPVTADGSEGSPVISARISNRGQFWSMGTLTFTNSPTTADFQYGSLTPSTTTAAMQVNGNVAFGTTPSVTVEGTALAAGTYPLIQYTGTISGVAPTSATLPAYASGYITNTANTIALVITNSTFTPSFTWGVGNGVWDTVTYNWKQFGTPTNYSNGDPVLFDDTASGSSPITVTLNSVVTPLAITANNSAKQYIITGTGSIAGAGAMDLLGGGSVTLTETNTYSGGTVITDGQLNINNGGDTNATATAIGTGTLTLNSGAAIDNTSGSNVTLQAAIPETWNGNFTYVGSSNDFNTGIGVATMNGSISVAVNSHDLTIGGPITDNGANYQITKTGGGALTLPVANAFTGGFTLVSGLLNLGDPNAITSGVLTIEGGAIDNISGSSLELGISYVWSGSFSFLGTTNMDLGSGTVIDSSGPVTVNVVSNTLYTGGNITSGNNVITKTGNGKWVFDGSATSANQLQLVVNAGEVDMDRSGGQSIGTGSSGLTVQTGALVLDLASFQVHSDTVSTPTPVTLSGGALDLNGFNENFDKLFISAGGTLRNSAAGSSTLNLISGYMAQLTGTNCQFDIAASGGILNFEGPIAGAGTLVKNGQGTLNLSSNNIYTGNTIINGGTLALVGVGSISNQAVIELAATNSALDLTTSTYVNANNNPVLALFPGQTLSGFGVVTGLVETVAGSTLAPGTPSATGVLTVTGFADTNFLDGVTLMKLNKGALTSDQLSVSGSLVYGGTLALTNLSGTLAPGDTFQLFNAAGGISGSFAAVVPSRPNYPAFGLAWNTNSLALNGSISIIAAIVPQSPKITGVSLSGTTLLIQGTNGVPNEPFVLLETTNLAVTPGDWMPVETNSFDQSGDFSLSITATNTPEEFFTLQLQ